MATVESKLITAEEFFDFCHRDENRDRHFELERGEIVEVSLPGKRHGVVCGNSAGILWTYTQRRRKGLVCPNDTGLILERDPDTVRGADIAWYSESEPFSDLNPKYDEGLPNLAVEVLSPNDRMLKRISLFLKAGVKMVWLLDPDSRNLTVFRRGQEPVVLEAEDELTGGDVLPDFRCQVADFFATPGE